MVLPADHNLTAFNNSAMELIPVVVSFLRNKSQGLDVTVDEERLRPAVKAFQADMQSTASLAMPSCPHCSRDYLSRIESAAIVIIIIIIK